MRRNVQRNKDIVGLCASYTRAKCTRSTSTKVIAIYTWGVTLIGKSMNIVWFPWEFVWCVSLLMFLSRREYCKIKVTEIFSDDFSFEIDFHRNYINFEDFFLICHDYLQFSVKFPIQVVINFHSKQKLLYKIATDCYTPCT